MILYKYLPSARIDVLSNFKIRYTQYGAFNDPFELNPNINKLTEATNIYDITKKDFKTLIEDTYEQYPVVHPLISKNDFIKLALPLENFLKPYVLENMNYFIEQLSAMMKNQFDSTIGALSLSEKSDNQLMWSHYSEYHKGFVISFNSEHEYFNQKLSPNDELRHLRKIVYKNERPKIDLMNANGVDVFLVKHTQWEYEAEWRIIRPFYDAAQKVENETYPIYLFDFPVDAVTSVILGCKMEEYNKTFIKKLLTSNSVYNHIKLYQADLDKETYNINLIRI